MMFSKKVNGQFQENIENCFDKLNYLRWEYLNTRVVLRTADKKYLTSSVVIGKTERIIKTRFRV